MAEKSQANKRNQWRTQRNTPFCWQEKEILYYLKQNYKGNERAKMLCLYMTLSWIDNDYYDQEGIDEFTKKVSDYSGLRKDWVPKGIKELEKHKIVKTEKLYTDRGYIESKVLYFTPENIAQNPNTRKAGIRDTKNPNTLKPGNTVLGDTIYKEDYYNKENNNIIKELLYRQKGKKRTKQQENMQNLIKSVDDKNELYWQRINERAKKHGLTEKESELCLKRFYDHYMQPAKGKDIPYWETLDKWHVEMRLNTWYDRAISYGEVKNGTKQDNRPRCKHGAIVGECSQCIMDSYDIAFDK